MFHDILVAADGSPHANEALRQAIDLAEHENARLTLITGVQKPPVIACLGLSFKGSAELDASVHSSAEAVLKRSVASVPRHVPVTSILTEEPIGTAIVEQVKRAGHDLVVMGSRGRGTVRAALLGSISHHVLHHSPVPVLIVHVDAQGAGAAHDKHGTTDRQPA